MFVVSECVPFAKTGGLADVVGALPKRAGRARLRRARRHAALRRDRLDAARALEGALGVPMSARRARGGAPGPAARQRRPGLPPRAPPLFDRRHLYGPPGRGYADNLARFTFLSRGALALCEALGLMPDVVHAHDWQSGARRRSTSNTVEWAPAARRQPRACSRSTTSPTRAVRAPTRCRDRPRREHFHSARARGLRHAQPAEGRPLPRDAAHHGQPDATRARSRRAAYGVGPRRRAARSRSATCAASSTASTTPSGTRRPTASAGALRRATTRRARRVCKARAAGEAGSARARRRAAPRHGRRASSSRRAST